MVNKNKKSASSSRSRVIFYSAAGIVIVAAAVFLGLHLHSSHVNSNTNGVTAGKAGKKSVDLTPATPADQADSDSHKQDIVDQQNNPPATSNTVTPAITYASQTGTQVEVDASVDGVVEDGGTCTLTATLGSATVTRTTTGVRNAQNTSCPAFILSRSDFSASGNWIVQVSYSSAKYNGTSAKQTLKID